MKTKTILSIAGSLLAVASLSACVGASQPELAPEVTKEAGTLGSRICFTNGTSMNITATPTGEVIGSNMVGTTGVVPTYDELCFAGRNSIRSFEKTPDSVFSGLQSTMRDAAVAVTVDGNTNTLFFSAYNPAYTAPLLKWSNKQESNRYWSGGAMSVGENVSASSGGNSFTVTRREDSDLYKEFLVQFTQ